MLTNKEVKSIARESLAKNWVMLGLLSLIVTIPGLVLPDTLYVVSMVISLVGGFFVLKATMGVVKDKAEFKLSEVFKLWDMDQFVAYLLTSLLSGLFVVLWTFIPFVGIVKSYSYMLAPYLALENPQVKPNDLITESRKLMNGYKMQAFMLGLSFILWIIGVVCTLGLLAVYVTPYMNIAMAVFYVKRMEASQNQNA